MTPQPQIETAPIESEGYKWKALATVAMGTLMVSMDVSITNIAFPALTQFFKKDLATVMWVSLAFILTSCSLMLIIGKIGDLFGRKKIYVVGTAVFTLGMLACALAQSIGQLVLFRVFQAVGSAMTVSCSVAIVTKAFPRNEMGRGLGMIGVAVSVGFVCGPVLGGILLDWVGWRSIYYLRVPLGVITTVMALILLRKDDISPGKIHLDLSGAVTSSMGILLVTLGLSQLKRMGPGSMWVWLLIGVGIISLVVFVLVEGRAADPIIDLSLFKDAVFSGASLSLFLFFMAAPVFFMIMPFYLMQGIGLKASAAGMLLSVNSITTIFSGPLGGWLSDRFGPVWPSTFGTGIMAVGFFLMLDFDLLTPVTHIIPVLILIGIGVGLFPPANNSVIMGAAGKEGLGSTSALIATDRQVGLSVGMALVGALFSARRGFHQAVSLREGIESTMAARMSISPAFHEVLVMGLILGLIAMALCLITKVRRSG